MMLPESPSAEMVAAGAGQLVAYLGCRPESAARWARELWDTMMRAHVASSIGALVSGSGEKPAWNAECVVGFLSEAGDTLKRLPSVGLAPARLKAWWPEVVRSQAEAYGMSATKTRPAAPDPAAIARLDGVTTWLFWLGEDARRIVWARANGTAWPLIARWDGRSERTMRYRHGEAVSAIAKKLNATTPRLHPFASAPVTTTRRRAA